MPKYRKYRWNDEVVRVNKGKYGSELRRDILKQCSEERNSLSNCDKVHRSDGAVDSRSSDTIMSNAFKEFNSKSYQIRTNALTTVSSQLQQNHNPDILERHHDSLINTIRNALKSKFICEVDAAVTLLSLAAIQLCDSNRSIQILYEPLLAVLNDKCLRLSTRFAVFQAIGILNFLYETDRNQIYFLLKRFKDIFAVKKKMMNSKLCYDLQRAAWTWTLLMKLIPTSSDKKPFFWTNIPQYIEKALETPSRQLKICGYVLDLSNWSVRVAYEMLSSAIGFGNITKHLSKNAKLLTKLFMAQTTECFPFSSRLIDVPPQPCDDKLSKKPYSFESSITPAPYECYIEKTFNNLLLATNKSSVERTKLIQNICNELYLFPNDNLEKQRNVILVVILKAMKRGDEAEQAAAVRMATLAVLQSVREERFCCELSNEFLKFLNHSPAAISTNASICTALAFIELANVELV